MVIIKVVRLLLCAGSAMAEEVKLIGGFLPYYSGLFKRRRNCPEDEGNLGSFLAG
jgi:hypothetical protein